MFEIERYSLSTEILLQIQRYNLRYSDTDETRNLGPVSIHREAIDPVFGRFCLLKAYT